MPGLLVILLGFAFTPDAAEAQNRFDILRYGMSQPGQDAANMGFGGPSVALGNDFGSYIRNPATSALFDQSFFSFGMGARNVNEEVSFQGSIRDAHDNQTGVTNLGFVFQAPTERGSLAFGIGYSQTTDFNRTSRTGTVNTQSTVTDYYLFDDPYYFDLAFDAFALDVAEIDGQDEYFSVWRYPFPWEGVDQFSTIEQRGQMGEYSLFASTEFLENFFVGASIGIPHGTYSFRRSFIEEPPPFDHQYDVEVMTASDRIDATVSGFKTRLGALYKIRPWFNVAASITSPTTLTIRENFSSEIQTSFTEPPLEDDDATEFRQEFDGEIRYEAQLPSTVTAGLALDDYRGLDASLTAEWVRYDQFAMGGLDEQDPRLQRDENEMIVEEFEDVVNLNAGLAFRINEQVKPRVGIAYHPSYLSHSLVDSPESWGAGLNSEIILNESDRFYYSAGVNVGLQEGMMLEFAVQMGGWENERLLYHFAYDAPAAVESTTERVRRLHGVIGLNITL